MSAEQPTTKAAIQGQDQNTPTMTTEAKSVPPPPLFLGNPKYVHGFNPSIPLYTAPASLRREQERDVSNRDDHLRTSIARVENKAYQPSSDPISRSQAVPIATLLTGQEPRASRQVRSDSLVAQTGHDPYRRPDHHQQGHAPASYHEPGPNTPASPTSKPHAQYWHVPPSEPRPTGTYPHPSAHYHPAPPLITTSQRPHRLSVHSPPSMSTDSRHTTSEPRSAVTEAPMSSQIPLLSPAPSPRRELEYTLHMRQQPKAARACGNGDRDRRVIDPPPIIQVRARDPVTGDAHIDSDSYTTLHCMLINASTGRDESFVSVPRTDGSGGANTTQQLVGCAVASPWVGQDERGERGSFFVFSDLSVRQTGRYKLLFRLLKVNPLDMANRRGEKNYIRATIESDVFEVFQAKEFPGMRASSALLKALRAQGLNVGVKKGSAAAAAASRQSQQGQQHSGPKDKDGGEENEDESDRDDASDAESGREGVLKKTKSVKRLRTA